ncbi:MAG TPA: TIGR03118 family protein [Candidatus Dormibacteraeota bacterium]
MHPRRILTFGLTGATAVALALPAVGVNAGIARGSFRETDLVSNIPGRAQHLDTNLVNPWGISASGSSPMWVSDNNAGVTTLYDGAGNGFPPPPNGPLVVKIPQPDGSDGGTPTGTVFNGGGGFNGDRFLFATEDGTIAGWNPAVNFTRARIEVDRSTVGLGAVYKGLAIGNNGSDHIYATNFRFGTIEVFDSSYAMVTLSGSFTDPGIPAGFAPFNIQTLGGVLYVTYAMQKPDKHDDQSGPGFGYVDAYDLNGQLLRRIASAGTLNSPWGLAIAPASFGNFHNNLLVGNFGDGRINAYNLGTGAFRGQLKSETSAAIEIPGLWGLRFGNGGVGASPNTLYFAAGINDEQDGLFGSIVNVDN